LRSQLCYTFRLTKFKQLDWLQQLRLLLKLQTRIRLKSNFLKVGIQIWLMMEHGCHQVRTWLNLTQFAIVPVALNTFIQKTNQITQLTTQSQTLDLIMMLLEHIKAWIGQKMMLIINGI